MTAGFRLYRGLAVYLLVYRHRATEPRSGRNYDEGFDAAVRIPESGSSGNTSRTRVFRPKGTKPFHGDGDAQRASTARAQNIIDTYSQGTHILDLEL